MKNPCALCNKEADLQCQRCGEFYCEASCQREDWIRHKYVCLAMPALVPAKSKSSEIIVKTVVANPDSDRKETKVVAPVTFGEPHMTPAATASFQWLESIVPNGNEFFESIVTYIESNNTFWIVDAENIPRVEELENSISLNAPQLKRPTYDDLVVGELVVVEAEKSLHRGHVIALKSDKKTVCVRLVDYGTILTVDLSKIYEANSNLKMQKSFALLVKLSSVSELQLNQNISLKLNGTRSRDGAYHVQSNIFAIARDLPIQILQEQVEVKLVKYLKKESAGESRSIALLQVCDSENLNIELSTCLQKSNNGPYTGPFKYKDYNFSIAVRTEEGFRRAILLDLIKKPNFIFLVYLVDEGRIMMTDEVFTLPSAFLQQAIRVFAVTFEAGQDLQKIDQPDSKLTMKFDSNLNVVRAAPGVLCSNGKNLCKVQATTFLGQLTDLDVKYWREDISTGSRVLIKHVVSYNEVYISLVQTKSYGEIFKHLNSECCNPIDNASNLKIGTIVQVSSPHAGHFRGEIISRVGDKYNVLDLDKGISHEVVADSLLMPSRFALHLPISGQRIKLESLCDIPPCVVNANNGVLQILQDLSSEMAEAVVNFTKEKPMCADLCMISGQRMSLKEHLLPLLFQPAAQSLKKTEPTERREMGNTTPIPETLQDFPPLPPSPPSSPIPKAATPSIKKRFYSDELKRVEIPLGPKVEVLLLHADDLQRAGYLVAGYFKDEKDAMDFQNFISEVAHHGKCEHNNVPGYKPKIGEICLAFFCEDQSWYRGECVDILENGLRILYFDFGNTDVVPFDKVKPIAKDIMNTRVFATKCYINGFNNRDNFAALHTYIVHHAKFKCTVEEGPEPFTRKITIVNQDKILSQEVV